MSREIIVNFVLIALMLIAVMISSRNSYFFRYIVDTAKFYSGFNS